MHPRCGLGEGPYYSTALNKLRFVDIANCKLFVIDLAKGPESLLTVDTNMPVSVTADLEDENPDENILVAAEDGVTKFNLQTGEHNYVAKYWTGHPEIQDKTRR